MYDDARTLRCSLLVSSFFLAKDNDVGIALGCVLIGREVNDVNGVFAPLHSCVQERMMARLPGKKCVDGLRTHIYLFIWIVSAPRLKTGFLLARECENRTSLQSVSSVILR